MFNVMHGLSFRVFRMARRSSRGQPLARQLEIPVLEKGQQEKLEAEAKVVLSKLQAKQALETKPEPVEKP